ncbi:MAG TPA: CoA-binding protein [Anaerolineae bacterium]|jgi:predicted CoA-binding protein|nr:CoA-binding protein [Anaerolineae bacterium]
MTDRQTVDEFLAQPALAVVGVSRSGKKFGNAAYKELKAKGYRVYPVHPQADAIEGDKCYKKLGDLPEAVGGVLTVVPPQQTEHVVRDAALVGIKRVWMQQGAESQEAIRFCEENGIAHVEGLCILMFAQPTALPHKLHRFIWGLIGKLPK